MSGSVRRGSEPITKIGNKSENRQRPPIFAAKRLSGGVYCCCLLLAVGRLPCFPAVGKFRIFRHKNIQLKISYLSKFTTLDLPYPAIYQITFITREKLCF